MCVRVCVCVCVLDGSLSLQDTLFLVLDTNVLISHLQFLMELKDYAIKGKGQLHYYPYYLLLHA